VPSTAAKSRLLAYALLSAAVLCWAGNWVIGRALRYDAPGVAITFWRWLIAFCILAPFTYKDLLARRGEVVRHWKILSLLTLFSVVFQHIPIYWGLRLTTATNGALLNSASPIFIVLLSIVLLHERLNLRAWAGTLISFAGVVTVICRGDPALILSLQLNLGDFWILVATLSWAGYTICLRWRPADLRGLDFLTLLALLGALFTAPLYLIEIASGQNLRLTPASLSGIAYIAVVATVIAYIAWNKGVEIIGPSRSGAFMYLMLVYTPILSIIFLGEDLHLYHLAGAALIISGITMANAGNAVRKAA
jgi:drug/metabolite transporter (DMT)-like permease